jgi:transcriptional regulator with XRE-family HTH domain
MKTFGEKLKEQLELDEINTEQLSKMINPPLTRQAVDYWLTMEEPPKKIYVRQLSEIFKCPVEYFYRDDESSAYQDLVYNKKLNEIDDYRILSELIINNPEFQKIYGVPEEIKELFEDEDVVESLKITGEELQILLTASSHFTHRFTKESYIQAFGDIKDFLSKRPQYFKK